MVVLEPLKVVITNFPSEAAITVSAPNIPGNDAAGTHNVIFDREMWIERSDFREVIFYFLTR